MYAQWGFWTGSGSTGLLDMHTASGGGPLGQLSLVFSLASMSSPLIRGVPNVPKQHQVLFLGECVSTPAVPLQGETLQLPDLKAQCESHCFTAAKSGFLVAGLAPKAPQHPPPQHTHTLVDPETSEWTNTVQGSSLVCRRLVCLGIL